jgi:hypothetical protein
VIAEGVAEYLAPEDLARLPEPLRRELRDLGLL